MQEQQLGDELLTTAQICEYLGVSRVTLHGYMRRESHPIPYMRVGRLARFDKAEVKRWAQDNARRERAHPRPPPPRGFASRRAKKKAATGGGSQ